MQQITMHSPILLLASDFPPDFSGGIQRHYHDLCRYAQGSISVLAPAPACEEFDAAQPFRIFRRRVPMSRHPLMRTMQGLLFVAQGLSLARRYGFGLILLGHWYMALFAAILCRPLGVPYAVMLHGGEMAPYLHRPLILRLTLAALRGASGLIVNSEFTRRQYLELGLPEEKLQVITPGVDAVRFSDPVDTALVRRRWHLDGKRILLTVATLVERKGHDVVLGALARVVRRFPEAHYLVVGSGPDEPRLRRIAAKLGVDRHVTFAGRVPDRDLAAYYQLCEVFVMPSRIVPGSSSGIEGFGIVYLEAGAAGKPVIAGAGSGAEEAVASGVSGLLVAPESMASVAEAVETLLGDRALAQELGRQGKTRAVNDFNLHSRAATLLGTTRSGLEIRHA